MMSSLVRRLLARAAATETESDQSPYPFVYVEADCTARELHADERTYLETDFEGGDGARPYIKSKYEQRDGSGDLRGYLRRSKLPAGASIKPAPLDDPSKPLDRDECIALLRAKGLEVTENLEVIENDDGRFTSGRIVHGSVDREGAEEGVGESSQVPTGSTEGDIRER